MDPNKTLLIELFRKNIKGKSPDTTERNSKHDGREGNWLEEQFGKKPDADNSPDFFGYELKNSTSSKTTFGDWSANEYIFKKGNYVYLFKGDKPYEKQDSFCAMFGNPNLKKNNRYSWSGKATPKINKYNGCGQILIVQSNLDIVVIYCYSKDNRSNKFSIIPNQLQINNLEIARWYGVKGEKSLSKKLENKFGEKGWFTCKKNKMGNYIEICFGKPFCFEQWIDLVKKGIVFFDSGMYQGNKRPYSQWRANNKYWDSLIIERYN